MTQIKDYFGSFARFINGFASSPAATATAFALVILWIASGSRLHYSDFWQLLMNTMSSVITFLMVFVLNNAQSRDTSAINAKLDSLILAMTGADNRLIGLESRTDSQAEIVLDQLQVSVDEAKEAIESAGESVDEVKSVLDAASDAQSRGSLP